MELKKAFMELQSKMVDTKQKLKMADLQIENLKRTITHSGNYISKNILLPIVLNIKKECNNRDKPVMPILF